jgi:hypothetical protein
VPAVHDSRDSLIPPALGRTPFEWTAEPKRFELVDGSTHHDTLAVGRARYRVALSGLPPAR